ncbi:uncharacterized protein LOC117805433 [Notolabrus celidotus]|uniref:uncharacterized protein LOC117805433 n=1 Tax=Notolabrus celidotus TaxID=1203425 RepID=UPI00149055F6|nr:uncharacterized protein LOC117805433 [Notolabrus celidotus]
MSPHVNWTNEEIQALLAVWSEENIQSGLGEPLRMRKVYGEVSHRLAAGGMVRSARQCRDKIKKLKMEYRRLQKQSEGGMDFRKNFRWYDEMDSILSGRTASSDDAEQSAVIQKFVISDKETDEAINTEVHGSYSDSNNITLINLNATDPTPYPTVNKQEPSFFSFQVEALDGPSTSTTVSHAAMQSSGRDTRWSKREVQALLTLWANPAVQDELQLNVRNNQVYARLSAALETFGFSKSTQKCREKIKKLKQDYKRMKHSQHRDGRQRTSTTVWFSIMDHVLGSRVPFGRDSEAANCLMPRQAECTMDEDDEAEAHWLPDEIQVLLTLWAQPNIQNQLLNTAMKTQVFQYLSGELTLVGFNKTPQQCSRKVNNLKEEYKQIKEEEPNGSAKSNWFAILDGVLGQASSEMDSSVSVTQTKPAEYEHQKDALQAVWTSEEVKVLLSRWAEDGVQQQLRYAPTNERVFAQLSSDLATQGFDKTTSQCRIKIRLLREKYRMIKKQKDLEEPKGGWFAIMDRVLRCEKRQDVTRQARGITDSSAEYLQTSPQELFDTAEDFGCSLSVSSLSLLVPTLRLTCAFAWHVVQHCKVMHYGKVEELVRMVTELAPEVLTSREKVQILLRLRARVVLELCRSGSTANSLSVQPHLMVIKSLTAGSTCGQEELEDLEDSKSNFVEVVQRLLEDTEERRMFFKEVFPIHYGQQYQAALKALVWKFISRLDCLLPVPDIKQTAEWLSTAPSVMEECGQMVLKPDQLKALLGFHQQQSGFTNKSYSETQNMFLPRLSLPPKPNTTLCGEPQGSATSDKEEEQFYVSEDEEPAKESPDDVTLTLRDCIKDEQNLKLRNKQVKDLTAENCSNFNNHLPSSLPTWSLFSSSDSQATGFMKQIREAHLIMEAPEKPNIVQKAAAKTYIPEGTGNTCYSETQNMFLPRLSLPPKPNTTLCGEPQGSATSDKEEEQFYISEDEEPAKESPDDVTLTLRDCIKDEQNLKLRNKQVKDLTAENCSSKQSSLRMKIFVFVLKICIYYFFDK